SLAPRQAKRAASRRRAETGGAGLCPRRAPKTPGLLHHVALPGSVLPHGVVVRLDRRIEVPHGVTAGAADPVTELETLEQARVPDRLAILLGAAGLGVHRRHDALRVLVARGLRVGIPDDVAEVSMRLRFSGPQITADSLHDLDSSASVAGSVA